MTPFRFLVRFAIFVLLFCVVAEGWLRYVTPASQLPLYRQNPKTLVYSVDPHAQRNGLSTIGRIPRRLGTWHVNDAGWLSPYHYSRRQPGHALVALFGDSYVAGLYSPVAQHIDVDLHKRLGQAVPVYAFGTDGWYLEQYVAMTRFVRATYDPSLIVILVAQGDVHASLSGDDMPYWYHLVRSGSGYREVPPSQVYVASKKIRLARESALFRYLRYNAHLHIPFVRGNDVEGAPTNADADAGTPQSETESAERPLVEAVAPVARFLVQRLCADNPGVSILIAARGSRYLPVRAVGSTPLPPDMEALREACAGHAQCYFLDLRMAFSVDWARHHVRFEATDSSHFNGYANAVAAHAIGDYIIAHHLLAARP